MTVIVEILIRVIQLFTLLIVIDVLLSYFMDPYQPIKRTLDQIVAPFLNPIRRALPQTGMVDFSPLVLIIILQILVMIIRALAN